MGLALKTSILNLLIFHEHFGQKLLINAVRIRNRISQKTLLNKSLKKIAR